MAKVECKKKGTPKLNPFSASTTKDHTHVGAFLSTLPGTLGSQQPRIALHAIAYPKHVSLYWTLLFPEIRTYFKDCTICTKDSINHIRTSLYMNSFSISCHSYVNSIKFAQAIKYFLVNSSWIVLALFCRGNIEPSYINSVINFRIVFHTL